MAGLQIDITTIVALWISGMLLLVALLGLVIRHSGVPLIAALAEYRRQGRRGDGVHRVQARLEELEQRLSLLENGALRQQRRNLTSASGVSSKQTTSAGAR